MPEIHPDEIDALVTEARRDPAVDPATWRDRATELIARRRAAGVPVEGRREFLRLGATSVVAAAVLAACSDDESAPPSETGVTEPEPSVTTFAPAQTTTPEEGADADATVFRTARSLELAMVEVYDALLGGSGALALPEEIAYDEGARSTLELLRTRHETHAESLVALVQRAGGEPVTEPNNGVIEGVVTPQLADLTTQRTVLLFVRSLEDVGAGTYGWGAGQVTTAELREALMAIGAVSARHGAAVSLLLDPSGADAARAPVLDTSGPARLPDHMLVTEGLDGGDTLAEPEEAGGEEAAEGEEGEDGTTDDSGSDEGSGSGEDSGSDAGAPQEDGEG